MGGHGATVLVVDDEQAIRLLCRVNLEIEGYAVLEAPTLGDARTLLQTGRVDVVLLDVHVGADDGWSLADELRDSEAGVRVALLTGSVDIGPADAARVDAVIRKPFSLDQLISTIRDLVGRETRAS